jgi:hypothetical protein
VWTAHAVDYLCFAHGLGTVRSRRRAAGALTGAELGRLLGLSQTSVKNWRHAGKLLASGRTKRGDYEYLPLDQQPEVARQRASERARMAGQACGVLHPLDEVQCG